MGGITMKDFKYLGLSFCLHRWVLDSNGFYRCSKCGAYNDWK